MIATRDKNVLLHIVEYCNQTDETVDLFGKSYETFSSSHTYRNACCLCLLQIGELVNALSEEFLKGHTAIPWKQIKGFRNIVAHAYGTVEPAVVWEIITDDLPQLKSYCSQIIYEET